MNTALSGISIAVGIIGIVITLFVSGFINMGGDNNGQIIHKNPGQISGREPINSQDSSVTVVIDKDTTYGTRTINSDQILEVNLESS